jgi:hypothetical protein
LREVSSKKEIKKGGGKEEAYWDKADAVVENVLANAARNVLFELVVGSSSVNYCPFRWRFNLWWFAGDLPCLFG